MAQIISGADGTVFSSWTTAGRPASPAAGQTGYNSTLGLLETYNGSSWIQGGGGGLWQSVQSSNFNATAGYSYPVNTTSATVTATLPASPTAGQTIAFTDYAGTWDTNAFFIDPNSGKINGGTSLYQSTTENGSVELVYIDSTRGWISINTVTPVAAQYTVEYLVVAGGGGGSGDSNPGGGGGAGGVVSSSQTFLGSTAYSITVGAGGAGIENTSSGGQGSNSVISGAAITTVTALGGGHGGITPSPFNGNGAGGGSGGGSSYSGSGGSGTAGQGNNGGSSAGQSGGVYGGGGGGGASGVGGSFSSPNAGAGGTATSSYSTWASATSSGVGGAYAGGGGGGSYSGTAGSGGGGGGANGYSATTGPAVPQAGTANTGGGGGGVGWSGTAGQGLGGAGGSGIVILRYSGAQKGTGGTVYSSGGYTYHKFTSSGTYTA